jgi:hypothetical protein
VIGNNVIGEAVKGYVRKNRKILSTAEPRLVRLDRHLVGRWTLRRVDERAIHLLHSAPPLDVAPNIKKDDMEEIKGEMDKVIKQDKMSRATETAR